MILIYNDFWHEIKMYNFDPYNVLLSIATNIPVLLMTNNNRVWFDETCFTEEGYSLSASGINEHKDAHV